MSDVEREVGRGVDVGRSQFTTRTPPDILGGPTIDAIVSVAGRQSETGECEDRERPATARRACRATQESANVRRFEAKASYAECEASRLRVTPSFGVVRQSSDSLARLRDRDADVDANVDARA